MSIDLGVSAALAGSIVLMALAGAPHCAAMCGAPCAAVLGARPKSTGWVFHVARLLSYSAVGAVLAAGVGQLGQAASASRALAPLWTLWHTLGLLWGLWMVVTARQPEVAERWLRAAVGAGRHDSAVVMMAPASSNRSRPALRRDITVAVTAGLAWVSWPCGLLQSALLVSSLAHSATGGALLMATFAGITAFGLAAAPALWRRFVARPGAAGAMAANHATRWAGVMLSAACSWALLDRTGVVAWCMSP